MSKRKITVDGLDPLADLIVNNAGDVLHNTGGSQSSLLGPRHTCIVQRTVGQNITSGVNSNFIWSEEDVYDPWDMHSPTTNNDRIYIKKTGFYMIHAFIDCNFNASGYRIIYLKKNGTQIAYNTCNAVTGTSTAFNFSSMEYLVEGDYLTIAMLQNSATTLGMIGRVAVLRWL